MIKKFISILLVILITAACNRNEKQPVRIKLYQFDKLIESKSTSLTIRKDKDYKEFLFGLKQLSDSVVQTISPYVKLFSTTDTVIIYEDFSAYLKANKVYQEGQHTRTVKKYYYDVADMADEEGFIFILDDERIIGFNSRAWDLYTLYEYNDTNIDSLLKNDSSDFFYKRIRNTK